MTDSLTPTRPENCDGFTPVMVVEEPVHALAREQARGGYRIFRGRDGFEVALLEHVIERMIAWGRRAAPMEWFGLVVGRTCEDDRGRHVVVLGVVPDPEARAEHGYVETSAASEFRTRTSARLLYPDGIIVGWVHGHVRHGARYSETDRRTQATWMQAHSLGIVVDPWDPREIAVYRGPECEEMARVRVEARHDGERIVPVPPRQEVVESPFCARAIALVRRHARGAGGVLALGCLATIVALQFRLVRIEARETAQQAQVVKLLRRIAGDTRPTPTPAAPVLPSVSLGAWCVAGEEFGFRDDVVSAVCFEPSP